MMNPEPSLLHFVKLGGSLLTVKERPLTPRPLVIQRLADEIARAWWPGRPLVLAHGSGSYGHVVGRRYRTRSGAGPDAGADPEGWRGFAETAHIAAQLHRLVMAALLRAGLPAMSLPPSALVRCHDGVIVHFAVEPVRLALKRGLLPVLFGDVAFDDHRGTTIVATEEVLAGLADHLPPVRISLVGVVDGVFEADPLRHPDARPIPHLTASQVRQPTALLGGSHGIDVTGGMAGKIAVMVDLLARHPGLRIHLLSGEEPGRLECHLRDPDLPLGTVLTWA
jgi:isopentenyl phosphate kinase